MVFYWPADKPVPMTVSMSISISGDAHTNRTALINSFPTIMPASYVKGMKRLYPANLTTHGRQQPWCHGCYRAASFLQMPGRDFLYIAEACDL